MKILRSIYIDIEQLERLEKLSSKTRVPKAAYIREALGLVLDRYEKQLPKPKSRPKQKR
jgi:predicted DNA-binding protein